MESFALPNAKFSHVRCSDCPTRERAVCAYANAGELRTLDAIKTYRDFDAGREIIAAGEVSPTVGSIVRGVVKLIKTLPDGRTQMVGLLFAGDFIGHALRANAEYDAVAATDVTLCLFVRRPFEALLRATPRLEQRLLEMTLNELDAAREWMLVLGRKTAREKIASLLAIIGRRDAALHLGRRNGVLTFDLPLTREAMADYLGLTLETVSRQISALRKDGVIELEGKRRVTVPDVNRLLEEAGDDSDGGMLV